MQSHGERCSTPTIHTSSTPGCKNISRQRHLPAQESPWPQLRYPTHRQLTIRHFRMRSRKPGQQAASKLDNRKCLGPWESCSFRHFAEGFKETSSYNHVLQLKFLPEWDVCISLISQKLEGSKPATTVLFTFPKYHSMGMWEIWIHFSLQSDEIWIYTSHQAIRFSISHSI